MNAIVAPILRAADGLASLVLPPRCPGCGSVVEADHRFCGRCWQALRFLGPPWCAGCAAPFEFDRGEGALCGPCLAAPPVHSGARAAVAYGDIARSVALRLKYGGRAAFAVTVARLMHRHLPADADLLVPVPLHRWRLWSRGYNQAALIADGLSEVSGVPAARALLHRQRATPALRGRDAAARVRAVAGAFSLAGNAGAVLRGRHVVLVDDVYTTGATAGACTRVLLKGGAAKVTILCWTRVIEEAVED